MFLFNPIFALIAAGAGAGAGLAIAVGTRSTPKLSFVTAESATSITVALMLEPSIGALLAAHAAFAVYVFFAAVLELIRRIVDKYRMP